MAERRPSQRSSQVSSDLPATAGGGETLLDLDEVAMLSQGEYVSSDGGVAEKVLFADPEVSERERRQERGLVEAACRGEESAIEALYRTHFNTIFRYVLVRLGSYSAAEDVTSQVFLGMVRGLGRYRYEGRPFVAWLYGIAQKQIAFFYRSRSRAPSSVDLEAAAELVSDGVGPDVSAEQRERRADIVRAMSKVPEGQREVLMLRYFLSLSIAETAEVVEKSEGAVKQLQLRGLQSLREVIDADGIEFYPE